MKRKDRQLVEERLALSLAVQQVPVLMIEKLVGILKERKEYRSFSGSHWELPEQGRMGRWKMLQLGHLHTIGMTTHKFWGVEYIPKPKLTGPGADLSPKDNPSKSSSKELVAACSCPFDGAGSSGSKSINDNSLLAFFPTPVVVPSVPLGILAAPSKSPFFTNLYRSIVRWILSLICFSFSTASVSSDSSSHIFWIFGCALWSAFANS